MSHPLDIQNAISLLTNAGYKIKKKKVEINFYETNTKSCSAPYCEINFTANLTDRQRENIIKALSCIINNDKPFTFTPSCGN